MLNRPGLVDMYAGPIQPHHHPRGLYASVTNIHSNLRFLECLLLLLQCNFLHFFDWPPTRRFCVGRREMRQWDIYKLKNRHDRHDGEEWGGVVDRGWTLWSINICNDKMHKCTNKATEIINPFTAIHDESWIWY